jgi:phosphoribosyl 1,2-cyclic phosphodiesterase/DNA-binding response OmpR family regulator
MRVRFWGTRGSIATPGPATLRYGGNTSCVQVETDRHCIVIDCGTGAAPLGAMLMQRPRPLRGHLLIGHSHWDHIQGLPFFAPLFVPGNEWDVYAPHGFLQSVRETLAGQMQHTYFPVGLEQLGATIRYHDLTEGEFEIGDVRVTTRYLNHPALTLGYRLEADGVSVAYCCDHEPHARLLAFGSGEIGLRERDHIRFVAGADLLIHDAQYRAPEYAAKIGWGHSTLEYAVMIAEQAGARALALTHHDPSRDDRTLDREIAALRDALAARGSALEVHAAAEGQELDLRPTAVPEAPRGPTQPDARVVAAPDLRPVLLGIADTALFDRLAEPLRADRIGVLRATTGAELLAVAASASPGLVVVEQALPGGGAALGQALRIGLAPDTPIIAVAQGPPEPIPSVDDWLVEPFTGAYARAHMRAWLMRTACRWAQPPLPADEARRVAALRALNILDTAREERFDRLTRLAAAAFAAPIALVSLVDRDRQWFKSAQGTQDSETPRDVSFCGHAILGDEVMVVSDALADPRFADNPAVTGPMRVRFYAGCPLKLDNGAMVGTLCIADTQPRQPGPALLDLLKDLASLVTRELQQTPRRG